MAHISFDSSNLTKFVNDNELGEMQALVTAVDKELREGTGAGNDFRGFLNLPVPSRNSLSTAVTKACISPSSLGLTNLVKLELSNEIWAI